MSETEPIVPFRPREPGPRPEYEASAAPTRRRVAFERRELEKILNVYGAKVAEGEWRDYALDFGSETAAFAIYRRTSEVPLYRIVKDPRLARRQGQYAVLGQSGQTLKRGHELDAVLKVFADKPRLVAPR